MKKQKILNIFVMTVLLTMVGVQTASFTFSPLVTPVLAVNYDATDMANFVDATLENITALISGVATGMGASVESGDPIFIGEASVRIATQDYNVFEFAQDGETLLHNAEPEFLNAYWNYVKATGIRDLGQIKASLQSAGMGASVSSVMAAMAAANDSAQASGFSAEIDEKFSIDDLVPDTTKAEYMYTDYNNYTYLPEVETKYSDLTKDLNKEDDGKKFITDADAAVEDKYENFLYGFDDVEADILEVLRANIASNNSDATTTYTSDDISILNYDYKVAVKTTYLSENFVDTIRDKIDEIMNGDVAAASFLSIFGLKIYLGTTVVPVKAAVQFDLFGALKGVIDNTLKTASDFISDPITTTSNLVEIAMKASPLYILGSSAIKVSCDALAPVKAALAPPLPQPVLKTIPVPVMKDAPQPAEWEVQSFTQKFEKNITTMLTPSAEEVQDNAAVATQLTGNAFTTVVTKDKPFFAMSPLVLLAIGAAILIGAILVIAFVRRRGGVIPI